jgi:very-short-patch-repair endonuclease
MNKITNDRSIEMNRKRWGNIDDRYNWVAFQKEHDSGKSVYSVRILMGISYSAYKIAVDKGLINVSKKYIRSKMSKETKELLSEKRKKWLKDNPDKHPWRKKDKFISKPCENVKKFLNELGVLFVEEYQPDIGDRSFSIDIAIPDKMIALEINGNQHYERDGKLKPYYQERHDLLESSGWCVYEIHYSACFNLDKWTDFSNKLKNSETKVSFDYFNYVSKAKIEKFCLDCSIKCHKQSFRCRDCQIKYVNSLPRKPRVKKSDSAQIRTENDAVESHSDNPFHHGTRKQVYTKIQWHNPEDLQIELWLKSTVKIAKELGVSDKAVEKFCKKSGLTKPPRGYWAKNKSL